MIIKLRKGAKKMNLENIHNKKYKFKKEIKKTRIKIVDSKPEKPYKTDERLYSYYNSLYRGDTATDPMGSYTGRPEQINEVPVQDADDL